MRKLIKTIEITIIRLIRIIMKWRASRVDARYEQMLDKMVCDKHKDDWESLDKAEQKKYKHEEYTYTIFKNLAEQFKEYPEYYVTDKKYIGEILPRLSPYNRTSTGNMFDTIFNDKNYFEKLFTNVRFPTAIVRCISGCFFDENYRKITKEQALSLLSTYPKVVFKKTLDTSHGDGVALVSNDKIPDTLEKYGNNFVVQVPIVQHEALSKFNSSSVNVIRIITVFWKGQVYVLDSRFRIGAPGSICDHLGYNGKNPLEIAVDDEGNLVGKAFDDTYGKYCDDIFGNEINGKIPMYKELVRIASEGQLLYPAYGLLGWDFTVSEDGTPMCIEVNSKQPCIKAGQCVNGPIFMKKTVDGNPLLDEIMSEPIRYGSMPLL